MVTFLPRGRRDSSFTIFSVTLLSRLCAIAEWIRNCLSNSKKRGKHTKSTTMLRWWVTVKILESPKESQIIFWTAMNVRLMIMLRWIAIVKIVQFLNESWTVFWTAKKKENYIKLMMVLTQCAMVKIEQSGLVFWTAKRDQPKSSVSKSTATARWGESLAVDCALVALWVTSLSPAIDEFFQRRLESSTLRWVSRSSFLLNSSN